MSHYLMLFLRDPVKYPPRHYLAYEVHSKYLHACIDMVWVDGGWLEKWEKDNPWHRSQF